MLALTFSGYIKQSVSHSPMLQWRRAYLDTDWKRNRPREPSKPPFAHGIAFPVKPLRNGTLTRDNETILVHVDTDVFFLHPRQFECSGYLVRLFGFVKIHSVYATRM